MLWLEGTEGSSVSNEYDTTEQFERPLGVPPIGEDCRAYAWPVRRIQPRKVVAKVGKWAAAVFYVFLVIRWWST